MAEPSATLVGICGASIGVASVCTITGFQGDLLVLGLVGAGFISYIHPKIAGLGRAAAAVFFSALVATYASPVVAKVFAIYMTHGELVWGVAQTSALIIGAAMPVALLPLLKRLGFEIEHRGLKAEQRGTEL